MTCYLIVGVTPITPIIEGGCFPHLPSLKIHFLLKAHIHRQSKTSQRLRLEFPPLIKTMPSLMKSWHLRQALYAGEILSNRMTFISATPAILLHQGHFAGKVFLSMSRTGIGMVSVAEKLSFNLEFLLYYCIVVTLK